MVPVSPHGDGRVALCSGRGRSGCPRSGAGVGGQ